MLSDTLKEIYEKADLSLDTDIDSFGALLSDIYSLEKDILLIKDPTVKARLEEKMKILLNTTVADHLTKKKEFLKNYYRFVEAVSSEKS